MQSIAPRPLPVCPVCRQPLVFAVPFSLGPLARALPGILPPMSLAETLEVTRVYSVAGLLPPGAPVIHHRPFRAPHHTVSYAGLVGGGVGLPRPGEISLARPGCQ